MSSAGYRIAMVAACPYPVPQGSQVLIRDTACLLRDRGHDVQLFTYGYGIGECPEGLALRGSSSESGRTKAGPSFAKPRQDYRLLQTLKLAMRRERFDIVYAHNYEGLAVAVAAGHAPIVYHAHNAMADELPHYFPIDPIPRRFGAWLDRSLPKRAAVVIAPHERLADYLVECGCARERVCVIPPSAPTMSADVHESVVGTVPVLYAGNLDAYQNLGLLEAAMAHARRSEPNLEWRVATSEPACSLRGTTYVHTPNYTSLVDTLSRDVVVACPRVSWSGYPIKLLNAMAAGKAIVACESAAYPIRDGVNGRVVRDGDVEAFGNALLELALDKALRRRLGAAARETMRGEHNGDRIGAAIESAIEMAATMKHAASAEHVVSSAQL